jgi:Fe-S-cluster containining protein
VSDERDRARVLRWVDAEDRRFLRVLDGDLAAGARIAGPHLACRIGCTDCCVGSFPITQLDARRLRRGLSLLSETNPARASAVLARAERAIEEHDVEGPCPALNPGTGGCELYDFRPVSCRTFGLPVRIGVDDLPPCRLCFTKAGAAEVESARVTIDPAGDEHAMLTAMSGAGITDESTTVADTLMAMRNGC